MPRLLTKSGIAGFGLNFQKCARMVFGGIGYSYEVVYQCVRRSWRFGQPRPVDAHVVLAQTELAIWDVVQRKAQEHERMKVAMFEASRRAQDKSETSPDYLASTRARLPAWLISDEEKSA